MSSQLRSALANFDASLPLEKALTIPNSWYFDPEIYEREATAIFGSMWQMVGRAAQVASPGSFLTADIANEPVLVVRDEKGVLRAFHNVCRHRAAPLLTEPCGRAAKLRCRYHGWTYDLTGKLRGTPEFDGVEDFCKQDFGLKEMHVAVCGQFVWAHLGEPQQTIEEFLGPLSDWFKDEMGMASLKYGGSHEYEVNCNWKVYVDNYLDGGYHVNTVHPRLAGVLDYARYKTDVYDWTSRQTAPLIANDQDALASKTRTGSHVAYWWVMPNFMVNIYEGVMDTNRVLPIGPNKCKVAFDFYFKETEGAAAEAYIKDSIAVAHEVQEEDIKICEEVQKGLGSRSFRAGRFSVRREAAGYHFHQLLGLKLVEGL